MKLSRTFIHECGLRPNENELQASLENILHLEEKLGVILIQLPASLKFSSKLADRFFQMIRGFYLGPLVIEPRDISWVSSGAKRLFRDHGISKVIADPERCPSEDPEILEAGDIRYYRLHGSPVIYKSSYSEEYLGALSRELKTHENVWCVFDNTTFGHATENALRLMM